MFENYNNFIGQSPNDNWVIIFDDLSRQAKFGALPDNFFPWDARFDDFPSKEDICLSVRSERVDLLNLPPSVIEAQAKIKYLSIPFQLIRHLEFLPENLETLAVSGHGRIEFLESAQYPQVKRLLTGANKIKFTASNFPNLEHLEVSVDREGSMLGRLPQFARLKVLNLERCSPDVLRTVKKLKLSYLRLNGSSLASVGELGEMKSLTDLWLHNWPKLTDISPVSKLANLEELTLSYCRRIAFVGNLVGLEKMQRFLVWRCNNHILNDMALALREKGVDASSS